MVKNLYFDFFKKIKNIFVTIKQKIRRGNEDNFTNNFKFS
ncbi:hypothetical protein K708_0084 [Campylobacter coli JL-CDD-LMH]|nr:hypothetical protein K708_0084 [Campylobacter coli JL-CDD-LMH]OWT31988.1 hypothetical protein K709_0011 [Campylobacter coli HN-CCD07046]CDL88029.1 hypothetical protein CCIPSID_930 [Campylobacter coli IPSID-1]